MTGKPAPVRPLSGPVPCGTCSRCCRDGEAIVLFPERGDDVSLYQTDSVPDPMTGKGTVRVIKRRADKSCIYIGPFGCTVYAKRPYTCRAFDCRRLVQLMSPELEAQMIAAGKATKAVLERGHELLAAELANPGSATPDAKPSPARR